MSDYKNLIEEVRLDVCKFFSERHVIDESLQVFHHPTGSYHVNARKYRQTDPTRNWIVCKIEVYKSYDNRLISTYITSGEVLMLCWLDKDQQEYLICPEDVMGQSLLNLKTGVLTSFSSDEDPFVWCAALPSPDGSLLAVEGCYWACPYELVIYDLQHVENLPWKPIRRFSIDNGEQIIGWKGSSAVQVGTGTSLRAIAIQ